MIPFGILLLLAGCETSVDFQSNALPKLTIISQVAPTVEGQHVYVYASQSPTDSSQFYTPEHLDVIVTEIETQITIQLNMILEGEKVFFIFPPGLLKAGFSYRITANAPGFESVQATTTIPKPSSISDLSIKTLSIDQSELNDFKKNIRYTIQFKINHFESNRYYHLVFYNQYVGLDQLYLVNPELSDNQTFIHHYAYGVLIDRHDLIEGQPLTFNFVDWVIRDNDLTRVYVELRTITEEYYKYHSSLARQLIVRQDPFAEPVTIFNNIEGGYGNFSGFTQDVSSSELPL